jgi:hypothetical protein
LIKSRPSTEGVLRALTMETGVGVVERWPSARKWRVRGKTEGKKSIRTGSRIKRKNIHARPAMKNRLSGAYGFREFRGE